MPFLGLDTEQNPIGQYYLKIRTALQDIHRSNGSNESVDFLIELATERLVFLLVSLLILSGIVHFFLQCEKYTGF